MEDHRRKNCSGDKFSFPVIAQPQEGDDDSDKFAEFEFGCVTPISPNSPADHLFFNGKLLPHAFPFQPTNTMMITSYSRSTSRASSISSKDSLMSSRSNSTNSRSSTSSCSTSARTSVSDSSDRRRYQAALAQQYGCSRRWQFIAPAPVAVNSQGRRRKRADGGKRKTGDQGKGKKGFGWRLFWWLVLACKECHAIEPSVRSRAVKV